MIHIRHCSTERKCSVYPTTSEEVLSRGADLFLAAVGYEKRSRYFAERCCITAGRKVAMAFSDRNTLSFQDNLAFFESARFEIHLCDPHQFEAAIRSMIDDLGGLGKDCVRICVDISSMSRSRLALIVEAVAYSSIQCNINIDFVYCLAEFSAPPEGPAFIESAAPVTPLFSGWTTTPDAPTCAIFGVGYEPDRVIGTVEYLEPGVVWAMVPEGPDERFLRSVLEVNETLWRDIPSEYVLHYRLDEPFNTFVHLESLVYSTKHDYRTILVPFGPKLFSLQCLLVSLAHFPEVAVWRVSGGVAETPAECEASGEVYAIGAQFERSYPMPEI